MSLYTLGLSMIVQQGKPPSYGLPVLVKAVEQAFDKRPSTGSAFQSQQLGSPAMVTVLASTLMGAVMGGYLSHKRCPKTVCVVMGTSFGATLGGVGATLLVSTAT